MIAGVAQIVFNVADIEVAAAPYLDRGWTETFRVRDLPNHRAKAGVQAVARESLDLVHLTPPDGSGAVELTAYAGAPPAGAAAFEHDGSVVRLAASDPEASIRFWTALGFRAEVDGVLEARAVLPAWRLAIHLDPPRPRSEPTSVDADGCVLVTVLTTAIDAELERLRATGLLLRSTAAWTEQIADRPTVVTIVEGPSGELVELLQAPRKRRDE